MREEAGKPMSAHRGRGLVALAALSAAAVTGALTTPPPATSPTAGEASLRGAASAELAPFETGGGASGRGTPVEPAVSLSDQAAVTVPASARARSGAQRTARPVFVPPVAYADIPDAALVAYQRAAMVMEAADEACSLDWQLLAAVGRVESDHGRADGGSLDEDGLRQPMLRGARLNGRKGKARVLDTDAGQLDGDKKFDRTVGPMQVLPSTWSVIGVDADGDGERNPQDVDDAALATAVHLCSGSDDVSTRLGRRAALKLLDADPAWVLLVARVRREYEADTPVVGDGPAGPVWGSVTDATLEAWSLGHADEVLGGLVDQVEQAGDAAGDQAKDTTPGATKGTKGAKGKDKGDKGKDKPKKKRKKKDRDKTKGGGKGHGTPTVEGPGTPGAPPADDDACPTDATPTSGPTDAGTTPPEPEGTEAPCPTDEASPSPSPSPSGTPSPSQTPSPSGTPSPSQTPSPSGSPSGEVEPGQPEASTLPDPDPSTEDEPCEVPSPTAPPTSPDPTGPAAPEDGTEAGTEAGPDDEATELCQPADEEQDEDEEPAADAGATPAP